MNNSKGSRLRVFTWHIHGSYLYYLSQGHYDIYIPANERRSEGYVGRGETYPFGPNVIEVPANEVRSIEFDIVLFQTDENYLTDQYEVLSEAQRSLPRIYLEHDPPWGHPTNERHPVSDPEVLIVHVTHFNALMWDCHGLQTRVIEHGVMPKPFSYQGTLQKGIVVINNLPTRGRLLGFDIFERIREKVPLDLVGMGTEDYGIGEVLHPHLPEFIAQYRFFFNPIRYTSLGLAVCEAMMLGMPVIGLATTEMAVTIRNGHTGFVATDPGELIDWMHRLLEQPGLARNIGMNAHNFARDQFSIARFTTQWEQLFNEMVREPSTHRYQ